MRLGRPSCSGSPYLADWTGCAGWIGGYGFKSQRLQLGSPRSAPRSRKVQARGEESNAGAVFFLLFLGVRASGAITC